MSETIYVQTADVIRLAVRRRETDVSVDVQLLEERWGKSRWISNGDTMLVPLHQVHDLADALKSVAGERQRP